MPKAFEVWVAALGEDLNADALPWLREVFTAHGAVEAEELRRLGRARQLKLVDAAVRLVGHDIATTTGLGAPPFEHNDDAAGIRLAYRGQPAPSPVLGMTQADVIVEVADFFQDEVIDDLQRPWPECKIHQVGLHISRSPQRAEWLCQFGPHVVAEIGGLTG